MIKETTDILNLNKFTDYNITLNAFSHILIYEENNEIVAFLDYSKMYEKLEINYIFVKNDYRRKNIAYKLIDYMIKNNDFENITLEVNVNNIGAIKLYEKHNFKIVSIRKKYYNGIDAYLMERRKK